MVRKQVDNPYLVERDGQVVPSEEGLAFLAGAVTNVDGRVYAFTGELSDAVVAAAMARLSRRMGDLRTTILDEFALSNDEERLIRDVVSRYGDDSVQQLISVSLVVEGASNLATKWLEWGRLAGYLEQSTRYIYFDQKDAEGRYNYLELRQLTTAAWFEYERAMELIFDNYSTVVRELTTYIRERYPQGDEPRSAWIQATRAQACDAARPLLPVATRSTVGLVGSAQAMEALVMRLLSESLPELQVLGHEILAELRKIIPSFVERADMPGRGEGISLYRRERREVMSEWADLMPADQAWLDESVVVTSLIPENVDWLVTEILFAQSRAGSKEILEEVQAWATEDKLMLIADYMGERLNRRHKPGRPFEVPHFRLEVVSDYGCFRDLQRHRMVDAMEFQSLTPYLGYEVPDLVVEAGLDRLFHETFEMSQQLYEFLASSGYPEEAQYATLLGHRMRYRWVMNMREAFHLLELRTQPAGHPGYRRLCQEIYRQVLGQSPIMAQYMTFINQGEDPELTRLSAERAAARRRAEDGLDEIEEDE